MSDPKIQSEDFPFLVFAGLRGTRPYAPSRVLRQLGCVQVIPEIGYMKKFATDHKDGQVSFDRMIIRGWKTRSLAGGKVPNKFNAECSDGYREWFKKNFAGTITTSHQPQEECQGSHSAHQYQYREDAKIIRQLRQELSKARQCMIELDIFGRSYGASNSNSRRSESRRGSNDKRLSTGILVFHMA